MHTGFFHPRRLLLSSEALRAPGSPPSLDKPPSRAFGTDELFYLDTSVDERHQRNNDVRVHGSYMKILHFKDIYWVNIKDAHSSSYLNFMPSA